MRLPTATTMIIKFLYGKKIKNVYGKKINNYWKTIIIVFFQSPISIIIEKINIHFNNYWNRYWKILFFAFQSGLKKCSILLIFSIRLNKFNPWTLRDYICVCVYPYYVCIYVCGCVHMYVYVYILRGILMVWLWEIPSGN